MSEEQIWGGLLRSVAFRAAVREVVLEELELLGLLPRPQPLGPPWLPTTTEEVDVEYMAPDEAARYRSDW